VSSRAESFARELTPALTLSAPGPEVSSNRQQVAPPVPAGFSGVEQPGHLGRRQVILGALVPVGGLGDVDRPTLDLSPVGGFHRHRRNPLLAREAGYQTHDKMRFL